MDLSEIAFELFMSLTKPGDNIDAIKKNAYTATQGAVYLLKEIQRLGAKPKETKTQTNFGLKEADF